MALKGPWIVAFKPPFSARNVRSITWAGSNRQEWIGSAANTNGVSKRSIANLIALDCDSFRLNGRRESGFFCLLDCAVFKTAESVIISGCFNSEMDPIVS